MALATNAAVIYNLYFFIVISAYNN
jgi:hypothetical protein